MYYLLSTIGGESYMFYYRKFKKAQELYNSLNKDYLKLRRDYWDLVKELDSLRNQDKDIEILELKFTIEKISKELIHCKELLTKYHLHFGDECLELFKKKCSKINKRTSNNIDDEGGDLI